MKERNSNLYRIEKIASNLYKQGKSEEEVKQVVKLYLKEMDRKIEDGFKY